ncbi:lipopolysaccharide assembly LapA domain-containing protein [Thermodesulfobacteriota bacterium]
MKHIKFILLVFIMLGVFIILVQNHESFSTTVTFKIDPKFMDPYLTPPMNIYLISLTAFILGVIITWVYSLLERFQFKRQINHLRKESREKENELNSLRNLPITSESVTPGIQENDVEFT